MKTVLLLTAVLTLFAAGCASKSSPPASPHTAALGIHLKTATAQTAEAGGFARRVGAALTAGRTNSERIDAKASVVLKWLE